LIVVSVSEGAQQVAPAQQAASSTILQLIDVLVSEGAIFAPHIFKDAFTPANELNHEGAWALAISCQNSKLMVVYFKRFLHFREDCGIFCEGEWEQQRQLKGHTGLVDCQ
jgi:hypothetical protein